MREACPATPLPEQVAALISLLASAVGRDQARAFRDCPLTPQQFAIARTLAETGPLMLSQVARVSCCGPANITGLVDRLERKGLVSGPPWLGAIARRAEPSRRT